MATSTNTFTSGAQGWRLPDGTTIAPVSPQETGSGGSTNGAFLGELAGNDGANVTLNVEKAYQLIGTSGTIAADFIKFDSWDSASTSATGADEVLGVFINGTEAFRFRPAENQTDGNGGFSLTTPTPLSGQFTANGITGTYTITPRTAADTELNGNADGQFRTDRIYGIQITYSGAQADSALTLGFGSNVNNDDAVSNGGVVTAGATYGIDNVQLNNVAALTLTGATLGTIADTNAVDTFGAFQGGRFDTDKSAGGNNSNDAFGGGTNGTLSGGEGNLTFALTGAGVTNIVVDGQIVGTQVNGTYGRFTVANNGNYQFEPFNDAINALPEGSAPRVDYSVRVTDENGGSSTATYTLNFTGAADTPTLTGGTLATYTDTVAVDPFAVREGRIDTNPTDATTANSVGNLRGDTDFGRVYSLQNGTAIVVNGVTVGTEVVGQYGRLVVANNGNYQYVPNAAAINGAPEGAAQDAFNIIVTDANGRVSAPAPFTVDITGAQDAAPTLTGGTIATITDTSANDTFGNGSGFGVITGNFDRDPSAANNSTTVVGANETADGDTTVGSLSGGTGALSYALLGAGVTTIMNGTAIAGYEVTGQYGTFRVSADGNYQFVPNAEVIDTLPGNVNPVLEYSIQVTDANGATSTATYSINIDGATDTTVLNGASLGSYTDTAATDDFAVINGRLIDNDPTDAVTNANSVGNLFGDVDATRTFVLVGGEGQQVNGITVGDQLVGTQINTAYGLLTLAADGRYEFTPNDAAINTLGADQRETLTFNVQVRDASGDQNEGGFTTSQFTIDLTGARDTAPVLAGGTIATYFDEENTFNVVEGQFDTNVNAANNSTSEIVFNNDGEGPGRFTVSTGQTGSLEGGNGPVRYALTGAGVTNLVANGVVVGYETANAYGTFRVTTSGRYQFVPNEAAINSLGEDSNAVANFAVQVTDANGLTSTTTYSVDLVGASDAPNTESTFVQLTETDAALTSTGTVFADGNTGDTLTYSYQPSTGGENDEGGTSFFIYDQNFGQRIELTDAQEAAFSSAFTVNAQTGEYTFNIASPDFLDPGQTLIAQYNVDVTNQRNETSNTYVEVDIRGTAEQGPAGTSGDDTLNGGAFGEIIDGRSGDDIINGNGGNDIIRGGSGDDVISGGTGVNSIDGGSGQDTAVFAGVRNDYFVNYNDSNGNGVADQGETVYITNFNTRDPETGNFSEAHQVVNVESFQFADGTVSLADIGRGGIPGGPLDLAAVVPHTIG